MNLTTIGLWLLALLAGVVLIRWIMKMVRRHRAEQAKQEQERQAADVQRQADEQKLEAIRAWGSKVKAAGQDYDAIMACGPPPDGARNYYAQREYASHYTLPSTPCKIYSAVSEWPQERTKLLCHWEKQDPFKSMKVLDRIAYGVFPDMPKADFVFGEGADRAFLQARYDEKLSELVSVILAADRHDAELLFRKLRHKLASMRNDFLWSLRDRFPDYEGALAFNLPYEWHDLVALFIKAPELEDFRIKKEDRLSVRDVLALATSAVNDRSLTDAKLALAYAAVQEHGYGSRRQRSRKWFPYREMLGDELVGDLARLIEELHEERKLFR
jgi:type II secretory pathway pseudopilin PulG